MIFPVSLSFGLVPFVVAFVEAVFPIVPTVAGVAACDAPLVRDDEDAVALVPFRLHGIKASLGVSMAVVVVFVQVAARGRKREAGKWPRVSAETLFSGGEAQGAAGLLPVPPLESSEEVSPQSRSSARLSYVMAVFVPLP